MTRAVVWLPEAVDDLLAIPDASEAAAVDAAVQRYARAAEGFVRRLPQIDTADEHRLYVQGAPYYARFHADDETVHIWRVIRRS